MTITEEISICANQLANEGKKPTVALVKAKLSKRAPLATIITTLKNWQHQPDFIAPTNKEEVTNLNKTNKKDSSQLIKELVDNGFIKEMIEQSLEQELSAMRKELDDMKLLIKNLSEQLTHKK